VAPAAPQQRRHDDPLVPTYYVREISSGTSSVTDLTFTTRRRPIWELLLLS
jgi:hypothetical protein